MNPAPFALFGVYFFEKIMPVVTNLLAIEHGRKSRFLVIDIMLVSMDEIAPFLCRLYSEMKLKGEKTDAGLSLIQLLWE